MVDLATWAVSCHVSINYYPAITFTASPVSVKAAGLFGYEADEEPD